MPKLYDNTLINHGRKGGKIVSRDPFGEAKWDVTAERQYVLNGQLTKTGINSKFEWRETGKQFNAYLPSRAVSNRKVGRAWAAIKDGLSVSPCNLYAWSVLSTALGECSFPDGTKRGWEMSDFSFPVYSAFKPVFSPMTNVTTRDFINLALAKSDVFNTWKLDASTGKKKVNTDIGILVRHYPLWTATGDRYELEAIKNSENKDYQHPRRVFFVLAKGHIAVVNDERVFAPFYAREDSSYFRLGGSLFDPPGKLMSDIPAGSEFQIAAASVGNFFCETAASLNGWGGWGRHKCHPWEHLRWKLVPGRMVWYLRGLDSAGAKRIEYTLPSSLITRIEDEYVKAGITTGIGRALSSFLGTLRTELAKAADVSPWTDRKTGYVPPEMLRLLALYVSGCRLRTRAGLSTQSGVILSYLAEDTTLLFSIETFKLN